MGHSELLKAKRGSIEKLRLKDALQRKIDASTRIRTISSFYK